MDETACKSYVQHLEFPKKRVRERNTLPLISWTIEKDVKALTNKLLKIYLKQKGKWKQGWVDWSCFHPHTREPYCQRCCRRWGISQFMGRGHKLRVQWFWWLIKWLSNIRRRVIWSDVCAGGRNPTSKLSMRESMGGDFSRGRRGVEINFCLMRGGRSQWLCHWKYRFS